MRSKAVLFLLALCLATTAWAGGEKCTADAQTCLNYLAQEGKAGWLGIEGDMTEAGYKITKLVDNGPAIDSGLKVGDVLVSLNGVKKDDANFQKVYKEAMKADNTVTFAFMRGDKEKSVKIKLAKMPEDVFAQMVGKHMIGHAQIETATKEEE